MERRDRTLDLEQARAFYDRFGARQDRQAFYEDAFERARGVPEFGCGTGRFAEVLVAERL